MRVTGGSASPADSATGILDVHTAIRNALLDARNVDGGWAYSRGRRSRLEPTCWALLALGHAEGKRPDIEVLRRWPSENGWLIDVANVPPNVPFNALAALTLLESRSAAAEVDALVARIVASSGGRFAQQWPLRQDNSLAAWSWIEGTFSWVEPTAWCLLLLKKRRSAASSEEAERIGVAERMLADRVCAAGGWNYGSSNVYGTDLLPYVPTTALALLSLQDRRDDPMVRRALERLQADASQERSALALSLSLICMRIYGVETGRIERLLTDVCASHSPALDEGDNVLGRAMALYALTGGSAAPLAFTV